MARDVSKGNRYRRVATAVVALTALGAAGVVIGRTVLEEWRTRPETFRQLWAAVVPPREPTAKPPSLPAEPDVDPASFRSRLSIVKVGQGASARPVVMMARPSCSEDIEGAIGDSAQSILLRELIRQAVLIAARDELGVSTRDEVMGEAVDAAPKDATAGVEVTSVFRKGRSRAAIRRTGEASREKKKADPVLYEARLTDWDTNDVIAKVEKLSRTEFVTALRKLGAKGKANPRPEAKAGAEPALPAGVEQSLAGLSLTDLFGAVRKLHGAIRTDGETTARLAALARAYALLGVLSEFHWHPAHKVFNARAFLYAERQVARDPEDPLAYWNRAFVRAVIGYHSDAQLDLDLAKKKVKALGDKAPAPPEWVALLDPFLRYDVRHLQSDRPELASLAGLLRLLAVEFPYERSQTLPIAQQILAREPDCFRAVDAICQVGGLNDLHVATVLGPRMLDTVVPAKVKALEQLPAGVRESIEANKGEPALVEALRQAGKPDADAKEPSWEVLGHLIAETRFIHVWRRLSFMRNRWSVPVDDFWAESLLSVAKHPYRRYLESFTLPPQDAIQALADQLEQFDAGSLENKEYPMTSALARLPIPRAPNAWKVGVVHLDGTAHDLAERMYTSGNMVKYAPPLLEVSPHSPYARAVLIEKDWETAKGKLAEWEADAASADSPTLLAALGKRYSTMGRIDDAQKVLKRYIAQSPSHWAYALLAKNEKDRGNVDLWKKTLDEYLERGENSGLDHATVQVELARHFMNKKQWSEALPYAEEAAKTWAAWALNCAGECNEAMGEYQRAEYWFRSDAERYPSAYLAWLNFCGRTYYGDAQAAAQFTLGYVNASQENLSDADKALAVVVFDLAGQPRDGLEFLRRLVGTERNTPATLGGRLDPWVEQMFLARYSDDEAVKDDTLRDATWADVARGDHVAAAAVAKMFRDAVAAEKATPVDTKALDKVLEEADPKSRSYLNYCAGCFFARHGTINDAVRYWEPCFKNMPGCGPYVPLLGRCALGTLLEKRIDDDDAHQHYLRAVIRRYDNRPEEALPDLDKALKLDPDMTIAWNLRGVLKRNLGDLDGAVADFTRLAELQPDETYGILGRAVCRIMQGNDDQARADIAKAFELTPKSAFADVVNGLLLNAQADKAGALEMFKKALDRDEHIGSTIEKLKQDVSRLRNTRRSPE